MQRWIITVTAEIPYPWSSTFQIERSSAGAAASEAIKKFRVAVKEKCHKSKKLDKLTLQILKSTVNCGNVGEDE